MSEGDRTPTIPERIAEPFRTALAAASAAWIEELGEQLISLVLFGSVARGDATSESDLDVVVVADQFPRSLADRRRPLLETWERVRASRDLPRVTWNLVTKTREEAVHRSPLYLDIVEDGILLLDRGGFFANVLAGMRARMRQLGSRRVFLPDGNWYWDLKPDFRWFEDVEI